MPRITKVHNGITLQACYHTHRSKPDMFGKTEGYRVTPPGDQHNYSEKGIYYRSEDDAAEHLLKNLDWGIRMGPAGATSGNIHHNGILIERVKR